MQTPSSPLLALMFDLDGTVEELSYAAEDARDFAKNEQMFPKAELRNWFNYTAENIEAIIRYVTRYDKGKSAHKYRPVTERVCGATTKRGTFCSSRRTFWTAADNENYWADGCRWHATRLTNEPVSFNGAKP